MAVFTFVIVETLVTPDSDGTPAAGSVASSIGAYSTALKSQLTRYWSDMSGGRVDLQWADDRQLTVSQKLAEWSTFDSKKKIAEVRAQSNIPGGTEIILIANDADTPKAQTPTGWSPYVHARWMSPNVVAHELGHFFEWRGSSKWGHSDIAREFFRDEYADHTCVMGGKDHELTFQDSSIPALVGLGNSRKSGPGMNPALVDQCGWLDTASPLVRRIDAGSLGSTGPLQPWRGAPPVGMTQGAPVVAYVDGLDPDGGRIYICVREASGWDRQFGKLWKPLAPMGAAPDLRLLAYLSTPSGDSLRLAWSYVSEGTQMTLGRVPLRVTVTHVNPEGVTLQLEKSAWRGSSVIEGVECDAAARIATTAAGGRIDAYVIDTDGAVRYNHYNGHGWEFKPWPVLDGISCDRKGGIAAVARKEGMIDIFVTDASGAVHRKRRMHTQWSDWQQLTGGGLHRQSSLAASRIDDNTVLLCGVRQDKQVSRVEVGDAGPLADWRSAPELDVTHVAATSDEAHRGRIYGVETPMRDRSLWVTPDVASPDTRFWGAVGTQRFDPIHPIAATLMVGARETVVAGTEPMTLLRFSGTDWLVEALGHTDRLPDGGVAAFSRHAESCEVAYIDRRGQVNVASWSPRVDFRPAANQYESQSMVLLGTGTGHFVQAKNGGGDGMGADGEQAGPWERLRMFECQTVPIDGGLTRRIVAFQTHNGQYVGAVGGGGSQVIAQASVVGPWELFYLDILPGDFGKVTIRCIDEIHFWTAPGGGGGPLGADKSEPKEWETFLMSATSV